MTTVVDAFSSIINKIENDIKNGYAKEQKHPEYETVRKTGIAIPNIEILRSTTISKGNVKRYGSGVNGSSRSSSSSSSIGKPMSVIDDVLPFTTANIPRYSKYAGSYTNNQYSYGKYRDDNLWNRFTQAARPSTARPSTARPSTARPSTTSDTFLNIQKKVKNNSSYLPISIPTLKEGMSHHSQQLQQQLKMKTNKMKIKNVLNVGGNIMMASNLQVGPFDIASFYLYNPMNSQAWSVCVNSTKVLKYPWLNKICNDSSSGEKAIATTTTAAAGGGNNNDVPVGVSNAEPQQILGNELEKTAAKRFVWKTICT